MSDFSPAQSAIYHLALALVRSGAVDPAELVDAANRVERDGRGSANGDWEAFGQVLRVAALDLEDEFTRPQLGVIDGGKADGAA